MGACCTCRAAAETNGGVTADRYDRGDITVAEARPGAVMLLRVLPPLTGLRAEVIYMEMRSRLSRRHWVTAAAASVVFVSANAAAWGSPVLHASPVVLLDRMFSADSATPGWTAAVGQLLGALLTIIGLNRAVRARPWRSRPGRWRPRADLQRAFELALHEERVWREGSEQWPLRSRVLACVAAGGLQLLALILPLSIALSTAALNGLFVCWYRRAAARDRSTAVVDTVALH